MTTQSLPSARDRVPSLSRLFTFTAIVIGILSLYLSSLSTSLAFSSFFGTNVFQDLGFIRDTICIYLPEALHHRTGCDQILDRIIMTNKRNGGDLRGSSCIFCEIVANSDMKTKSNTESVSTSEKSRVVYKDEELTMFEDINPSARLHFLIVPNQHIGTVKDLKKSDSAMIRRMQELGTSFLTNKSIPVQDRQYGFHVPPFTSVGHLHMHVFAKPFKSFIRAAKYSEVWGWERWWISAERLVQSMDAFQGGADQTWNWDWVYSMKRQYR